MAKPIINSFLKELKSTGTKKLKKENLNIIDKKIKKGISWISVEGVTQWNKRYYTSDYVFRKQRIKPLMITSLPLMKGVLSPLAKSVLIPFGLSAVMSAADGAIQNKIYRSRTTVLIIKNRRYNENS